MDVCWRYNIIPIPRILAGKPLVTITKEERHRATDIVMYGPPAADFFATQLTPLCLEFIRHIVKKRTDTVQLQEGGVVMLRVEGNTDVVGVVHLDLVRPCLQEYLDFRRFYRAIIQNTIYLKYN